MEEEGAKAVSDMAYREINRRAAVDQEESGRSEAAAKAWQTGLATLRADWSPWAVANLVGDPDIDLSAVGDALPTAVPSTLSSTEGAVDPLSAIDSAGLDESDDGVASDEQRWKLSEHVDAMWRRMLLERNFEFDDHIEHSYRLEEERNHAAPKPATVADDTILNLVDAQKLKKDEAWADDVEVICVLNPTNVYTSPRAKDSDLTGPHHLPTRHPTMTPPGGGRRVGHRVRWQWRRGG